MKFLPEKARNAAAFLFTYFIAYKYAMSFDPDVPSPFWYPDSVLISSLFMTPAATWWIYIASCLPVRLLVSVPPDAPAWFLLVCFFNDSAKAALAVWLVRKAIRGPRLFDAVSSAGIYLVIAAGLVPAVSAIGGAWARKALGDPFWPVWRQWFIGDALANLVLTPMLLSIGSEWKHARKANPLMFLEGFVLAAGIMFTAQGTFRQRIGGADFEPLLLYAPVPFLLWAAVRFGVTGASSGLFIMGLISLNAALQGRGPFSGSPIGQNVLAIQLFMVVLSVPLILVAVLLQQHRRTVASLRESERRFRDLADSSPIMVWMSGVDALCTYFNKPWLEFTGRRIEQELGNGWTDGVHPNDRDRCVRDYFRAFEAREEFILEYRLRRKDGIYRWVLDNGVPRFAPDNRFIGYIGSCVDITDRRETEQKLRESERMLRRLSAQAIHAQEAERRRIAQELHDDLAQRVAALSVHLSLLASENQPYSERCWTLQQRASEISIDLARLSHGLRPTGLESLGLNGALQKLAAESSNQGIEVIFTESGVLPHIPSEAALSLYRVAQEAVQNALKHSQADTIEIVLRSSTDVVEVSISDDGRGFSSESAQGQGLGLAGMAERMRVAGGTLDICSQVSQGTEIHASLPLRSAVLAE